MITQYEVYSLLTTELPQLAEKNYPSRASLQMYAALNYFTDYTKHVVKDHNFGVARKCFAIAEKLYLQGDPLVRLIIENSFVYSFSSLLPQGRTERLVIKSIIPTSLYSIYIKQVMQSGD